MQSNRRQFAFLVVLATAVPSLAFAEAWGLGAAVLPEPGLSVQYAGDHGSAYHVAAHVGNATASLHADWQRFHHPRFARSASWRAGGYAGLGLGGKASRDGEARGDQPGEIWRLRLPVGVQLDLQDWHLSLFVEGAPAIGPLPTTRLSATAGGGIRARF